MRSTPSGTAEHVTVQSVTAALDAGKTTAQVLGVVIDKLAAVGKISPTDAEAAKKLEQRPDDGKSRNRSRNAQASRAERSAVSRRLR